VREHSAGMVYHDYNHPDKLHISDTWSFQMDAEVFHPIRDILMPRIKAQWVENIVINQSHVLESYLPYGIHTDVLAGNFDLNGPYTAAWTFIIPLDDYDTHTVVFNEQDEVCKSVGEWFNTRGIKPYDPPRITEEQYQKYFSHILRSDLDYLSIEDIFRWKKGSVFAADRRKFHTSDNYIGNGINGKRAIIIWSGFLKD